MMMDNERGKTMSSEKMHILKMLEEGKINSDEAARLLQSVGTGRSTEPQQTQSYNAGHTTNSSHMPNQNSGSYGRQSGGYAQSDSYTQSGNSQYGNGRSSGAGTSTGFDDFATDLRRKFEVLAKDMEPKIQRFVGTVAEKTADVADRISKNINEPEPYRSTPRTSGAQPQPSRPAPAATHTSGISPRSFELRVEPGYNELNLKAHNGDISITGYNGDKITVNIYAKEACAGARLELMRLGSRYCLNYNESDFKTVSVEALVPDKLFSTIVVGTSNGLTNVSNITTEYFTAQSNNGGAAFRNIHAENIRIETSNGRLGLDDISAKNAHIEGSSGAVDANYLDAANLRLLSSNAGITLNAGDFRQGTDYTWIIESSNGRVALNVPSSPRNGYHIKAATSLGNVRFGLPALNYLSNTPNSAEAVSAGYDSTAVRVKISAETSNGELSIN